MKRKCEHAGVGWLVSEELLCTKMKGSAIHKRLTLLHLPCLCLCLLFSSTSAVNESRLRLKTGEWTQWQGKRRWGTGKDKVFVSEEHRGGRWGWEIMRIRGRKKLIRWGGKRFRKKRKGKDHQQRECRANAARITRFYSEPVKERN